MCNKKRIDNAMIIERKGVFKMNFDREAKNNSIAKFLTTFLALLISLMVLSSAVFAGANVDIWMDKDTYNLGERGTVYFDFPRSGSYTLEQIEPRHKTIIRNQRASAGRNTLMGTMESPTGRKIIRVTFKDNYGNRYTARTSYYVRGSEDRSGGQGQGGSEGDSGEGPSLSYFMNREPSQRDNVARSLQNQVQVIRPGDSNYSQLESSLNSKARSMDLSREQQNTSSFEFSVGSSGMEFSIDRNKQNYSLLSRSLNNEGVTFFGSKKGNNYFLTSGMKDPSPGGGGESPGGGGHCICRLPCSCVGCCSPIFICLPSWTPWPLPPQWIMWIIFMT